MIESSIVLKILVMCMFQINPSFDKKQCVKHMTKCVQQTEFHNCSEYWEPLASYSSKDEYNY